MPNLAITVPIDERLVISALLDRVIYEEGPTVSAEDAAELARLVPFTGIRNGLRLVGRVSDSSAGHAAGVGDVRLDTDRQFDLDAIRQPVVRAGQWKIIRDRRTIEVTQVMADEFDEARSCLFRYHRDGTPRDLQIRAIRNLRIPVIFASFVISSARWVPWKSVRHGSSA